MGVPYPSEAVGNAHVLISHAHAYTQTFADLFLSTLSKLPTFQRHRINRKRELLYVCKEYRSMQMQR